MRSLELTSSSSPLGPGTRRGVLYDDRPFPRSAFQRSFPVRASSAIKYEADS
jgi:hypothetical protein